MNIRKPAWVARLLFASSEALEARSRRPDPA